LIITADGDVRFIPLAEELAASAPAIPGWRITALKPALPAEDIRIEVDGLSFAAENLFFIRHEDSNYPEKIAVEIVYRGYDSTREEVINNGIILFLDNILGEERAATVIDELLLGDAAIADGDKLPISKLASYLDWRQREIAATEQAGELSLPDANFVPIRLGSGENAASSALIDFALLDWPDKLQLPWILEINCRYIGSAEFSEEALTEVEGLSFNLNGRLTKEQKFVYFGRHYQQVQPFSCSHYYAFADFRVAAKAASGCKAVGAGTWQVEYNIYKDRYWESLLRFNPR
jgi:hypothetical protein